MTLRHSASPWFTAGKPLSTERPASRERSMPFWASAYWFCRV